MERSVFWPSKWLKIYSDNSDIDYCLVVAAEEADWLLCDAYQRWRLLRSGPPIEAFGRPPRGTILSEGAGAVLLGRDGPVGIDAISTGAHYRQRREAGRKLRGSFEADRRTRKSELLSPAQTAPSLIRRKPMRLGKTIPGAPVYTPKPALGESVAAGGLWQVIVAAQVLTTKAASFSAIELPRPRNRIRRFPAGAGLRESNRDQLRTQPAGRRRPVVDLG